LLCGDQTSQKERHHLFLAGTAAGVAAGFNAPIAGVFFAIECGNRYLSKSTVQLDEDAPDGPRADIAAIVVAAALADIVVRLGLHETSALRLQGNFYAMNSPFFELPMYMGLGLLCGAVSTVFTSLRDAFTELFAGQSWGAQYPFASLPKASHPLVGGVLCGVIAVLRPQTLFVGYATLDQLLAGKIQLALPLLSQLLGLKLVLSSFALGSGLIGGAFAPSLFFGAAAGTAYHDLLSSFIDYVNHWAVSQHIVSGLVNNALAVANEVSILPTDVAFFTIATAPAYATVGAAATLGALFRAPLTSSMLMFELTQNHDIVLPVLVSSGLGGLFAEILSQPRRLW
jgi:H+/Cl- antiporter ClcA